MNPFRNFFNIASFFSFNTLIAVHVTVITFVKKQRVKADNLN